MSQIATAVPPGTYFLGDPCYALGHRWEEVCAIHWAPGSCNTADCAAFYDLDGYRVVEFHTKHGDGGYYDQFGHEYGVDSGTLGLVPVELIDFEQSTREYLDRCGQIVTFDEPADCYTAGRGGDGVLRFGSYHIETDDPEPEEERCYECGYLAEDCVCWDDEDEDYDEPSCEANCTPGGCDCDPEYVYV